MCWKSGGEGAASQLWRLAAANEGLHEVSEASGSYSDFESGESGEKMPSKSSARALRVLLPSRCFAVGSRFKSCGIPPLPSRLSNRKDKAKRNQKEVQAALNEAYGNNVPLHLEEIAHRLVPEPRHPRLSKDESQDKRLKEEFDLTICYLYMFNCIRYL